MLWNRFDLANQKQTKYMAILCVICNLVGIKFFSTIASRIFTRSLFRVYLCFPTQICLHLRDPRWKRGSELAALFCRSAFPVLGPSPFPRRALLTASAAKKALECCLTVTLICTMTSHNIGNMTVQIWGQPGEDLAGEWTAHAPVPLFGEEEEVRWCLNEVTRWSRALGQGQCTTVVNSRMLSVSEVRYTAAKN